MALNEHIWGLEIKEQIQQLQLLTSNSTVARPWRFFSASFLAELVEKGKAGSSGNQEKPPLAKPNYLGRSRKILRLLLWLVLEDRNAIKLKFHWARS